MPQRRAAFGGCRPTCFECTCAIAPQLLGPPPKSARVACVVQHFEVDTRHSPAQLCNRSRIRQRPKHVDAAGCVQVINSVLKDPEDTTEMALIYANQTADDILLRADLEALAAKHPNFRVWHTGENLTCCSPVQMNKGSKTQTAHRWRAGL